MQTRTFTYSHAHTCVYSKSINNNNNKNDKEFNFIPKKMCTNTSIARFMRSTSRVAQEAACGKRNRYKRNPKTCHLQPPLFELSLSFD